MRPQLSEYGLIVCNFRADEIVHRIYTAEGPHIRVRIPAHVFLSQLTVGKAETLTPVDHRGLGDIEMLSGYPAVDCGHGSRQILSLTVSVYRDPAATKFHLVGTASEPLDPTSNTGSKLEPGAVAFSCWFEIDDNDLSDFLPNPEERQEFQSLIAGVAHNKSQERTE